MSWSFFSERIPYEEALLMKFYPQYVAYASKTAVGIPGINSPAYIAAVAAGLAK